VTQQKSRRFWADFDLKKLDRFLELRAKRGDLRIDVTFHVGAAD
jgi:hypothetical protein